MVPLNVKSTLANVCMIVSAAAPNPLAPTVVLKPAPILTKLVVLVPVDTASAPASPCDDMLCAKDFYASQRPCSPISDSETLCNPGSPTTKASPVLCEFEMEAAVDDNGSYEVLLSEDELYRDCFGYYAEWETESDSDSIVIHPTPPDSETSSVADDDELEEQHQQHQHQPAPRPKAACNYRKLTPDELGFMGFFEKKMLATANSVDVLVHFGRFLENNQDDETCVVLLDIMGPAIAVAREIEALYQRSLVHDDLGGLFVDIASSLRALAGPLEQHVDGLEQVVGTWLELEAWGPLPNLIKSVDHRNLLYKTVKGLGAVIVRDLCKDVVDELCSLVYRSGMRLTFQEWREQAVGASWEVRMIAQGYHHDVVRPFRFYRPEEEVQEVQQLEEQLSAVEISDLLDETMNEPLELVVDTPVPVQSKPSKAKKLFSKIKSAFSRKNKQQSPQAQQEQQQQQPAPRPSIATRILSKLTASRRRQL